MSITNPAPEDLTTLWLNSYEHYRNNEKLLREEAAVAASEFMRAVILPQRPADVANTIAEMTAGIETLI